MARDERFKKYQDAGADFLETARVRAEEFLRELSKAGESTQRQGRGALDDLLEGSRKGTEQMIESIRSEIRSQLSLLGLATKEDLAALERRLSGTRAAPAKKTATKTSAAKRTAPRKTTTKSTATRASTAKSAAKKSSASKKATGRT